MCIFINRDVRKLDHSYNNDEKLGQSYTFLRKIGAYCIPAKVHIRTMLPPPPPEYGAFIH